MKNSTKAILLSTFLFPGLGHIYLKRYIPGAILMTGSTFTLYFIVSSIVNTAMQIAEKIESGAVPLDPASISCLVSQQSPGMEQSVNIATIVLAALWLVGILDSYRLGKAEDKTNEAPPNRET